MNLSLIAGVVMLLVWGVLLAVAQPATGTIHLLLAGGVVLLARRVLVGAPKFLS